MLSRFADGADHIVLAVGATDFRKQIEGLSVLVNTKFKMDPFADGYVFVFCNKKRDALKALRYDRNGFVPASKKLLDRMKFRWPKTPADVREITPKQLQWLLDGLEIEQEKAHHPVEINAEKSCF